jgi:hypothetical protein
MKKPNFNHAPLWVTQTVAVVTLLFSGSSAISQNGPALAHKFIAGGTGVKSLDGYVLRVTKDDRIILGGNVELPKSERYNGSRWRGCADATGKVLWATNFPVGTDGPRSRLETDGDRIWASIMTKGGLFQLAKFETPSLQKNTSMQMTFETTSLAFVSMHSETDRDFDLQTSIVQTIGNSIRVALFSRDLRLVIDKLYSIPSDGGTPFNADAGSFTRLPDRTGYYIFLRYVVPDESKPVGRIGVIRLDNAGAIKWASGYILDFSDTGIEPQVADDGSILITPVLNYNSRRGHLVKIGSDGAVNWAIVTEGIGISLPDHNHPSEPYRFSEPYLLACGGQTGSKGQPTSTILGINYQTGRIEHQLKFGPNTPGVIVFRAKDTKSFYVYLLDMSNSFRSIYHCALLRFDFDFNLLAARRFPKGEPDFAPVHILSSGARLVSFNHPKERMLIAQTVSDNLEGANRCGLWEKEAFSFMPSNFQARPVIVPTAPLSGISVSEAHSKTSEAEMKLMPLQLNNIACETQERP